MFTPWDGVSVGRVIVRIFKINNEDKEKEMSKVDEYINLSEKARRAHMQLDLEHCGISINCEGGLNFSGFNGVLDKEEAQKLANFLVDCYQ